MSSFSFLPPDPYCWHCGGSGVVQRRPPLCEACAELARVRLLEFFARSRSLKRIKRGDIRRARYDTDTTQLTAERELAAGLELVAMIERAWRRSC